MQKNAVYICNKALDELGERAEISNIENPSTEEEQIMARWYADTLADVLRKYVWNFAICGVEIPNTTPDEDDATFELPSDFVRLLSINGRRDFNNLDFDFRGRSIRMKGRTNDSIKIEYIKLETDVNLWDAGFMKIMVLQLAANVSYKFTGKSTVKDRLLKEIELEEAKIVSIDGQERPPVRVQYSRYRRARHGTGTIRLHGTY